MNFPTQCPSCNSTLEQVNEQLFCINKACPAQTLKKLVHFCKVMQIKGLGEKTLEKLEFETIEDIYSFSDFFYRDVLGDTVGNKIIQEIEKSKNQKFSTVLEAFGISLIGSTASKKIGSVVNAFEDISEETCKKAGLGPTAINNLMNWINSEEYLLVPFRFEDNTVVSDKPTNSGVVVCITGKLNDYKNRNDAKVYLESKGFEVTDSVTNKTNILVDEEGRPSSKREKAEKLNIPILTIQELIKKYDNHNS